MQFLRKNKIILLLITIAFSFSACSNEIPAESIPTIETFDNTSDIFSTTKEDVRTIARDALKSLHFTGIEKDIIIDEGGDYELSGALNGQILIRAEENVVHLFLNNVQIKSNNGSAIYVESASKLVLTSLPGTENILTDSKNIDEADISDACIYSESDVTINGEGSLQIQGRNKKGLHSKDILKIIKTNLYSQSLGDSIQGNDGICIFQSDIKIQSQGNGIRTTKSGKNHKGCIDISESNISISSGQYGIVTDDDLYVSSSKVLISTMFNLTKVNGKTFIDEDNIQKH